MTGGLVRWHGKGSHATLFLGSHRTTLKDLKQEIGESLLNDMCRQLGISKKDLFEGDRG